MALVGCRFLESWKKVGHRVHCGCRVSARGGLPEVKLIWAFLGLRSVRSVCVLFVGLGVEFNESAVVCLSQPLRTNVLLVLGNGFTNYL